jgi:hypothetical protein
MVALSPKDIATYGTYGSIALTLTGCATLFCLPGPAPQRRSHMAYRCIFALTNLLFALSWSSEPYRMLQNTAARFVLGVWERWLLASLVVIPALPVLEIIMMRKARSRENDKALTLDCVLAIAFLAFILVVLTRVLPAMAS